MTALLIMLGVLAYLVVGACTSYVASRLIFNRGWADDEFDAGISGVFWPLAWLFGVGVIIYFLITVSIWLPDRLENRRARIAQRERDDGWEVQKICPPPDGDF